MISIHASLAGGDVHKVLEQGNRQNFNPRLPCGRRRYAPCAFKRRINISIHASLAGGDVKGVNVVIDEIISIHASLAGGD